MKKRMASVILIFAMLCSMLTSLLPNAVAASQMSATPYANVEYGYSAEVSTGTIRYVAQNYSSEYFLSAYWPTSSFGSYASPETECGTACISMALSYVGVNRTPKELLEATNGVTCNMWGAQGSAKSSAVSISTSAISTAMDNYINGNGKYSPLCIYIQPWSSTSPMHWVLLVGKLGDNKYLALNPWHTSGTDATLTIQINGTTATYNNTTNPITSVNQCYNPDATPSLVTASYPAYCSVKVTASTTYIKSLPCSESTDANSSTVETATKGTQYQAIELVKNTAGNLWYKVQTKSGTTGYLYAGECSYVSQSTKDISGPGITAPSNHTYGNVFVITGKVSSTYNQLTAVSAYVYSGSSAQGTAETSGSASVSGNSITLGGSSIDSKTEFNKLSVGTHTYVVRASYKNYYAKSATTLGTNTGETEVYRATFNVVSAATTCSHSYTSAVTKAATCVSNGVRTYTCSKCGASYTETIAATGVHTYGSWSVTKAATCTTSGTKTRSCTVCGTEETQTISATGHSYGSWVTVTAAGCTKAGRQKKTCSSCGDVQTQSIAATGHNYTSVTVPASCTENEKVRYTCKNCGDNYDVYAEGNYSEWSETKPVGVEESRIETKTQYRYADYETKTSYSTSLSGYTLISSTWEKSGSGTVKYVKSWSSGFYTGHSLYSTYNKSAVSASETTTNKTVINSNSVTG